MFKNKKGFQVGTSKLIAIVIVVLVLLAVFTFIFRLSIPKILNFIPEYGVTESDKVIIVEGTDEEVKSDCQVLIGVIHTIDTGWLDFSGTSYLYFCQDLGNCKGGDTLVQSKIIFDGTKNDGSLEIDQNWNEAFGKVSGGIFLLFSDFTEKKGKYISEKEDLPSDQIIKNLHGASLLPGNRICRKELSE